MINESHDGRERPLEALTHRGQNCFTLSVAAMCLWRDCVTENIFFSVFWRRTRQRGARGLYIHHTPKIHFFVFFFFIIHHLILKCLNTIATPKRKISRLEPANKKYLDHYLQSLRNANSVHIFHPIKSSIFALLGSNNQLFLRFIFHFYWLSTWILDAGHAWASPKIRRYQYLN